MVEAKVTSKYQVTIPKKIRKIFGIKVGDKLIFTPSGDKTIVEKKGQVRLSRELPLEIEVRKVEDVHEWREIARREATKRHGD